MRKAALWVGILIGMAACGQAKRQAVSQDAAAAVPDTAAATPLARLNGQAITNDDIRKIAGGRLSQAEMDLFEVRESTIRQVIEDRLLEAEASRRGLSKDDLTKKEVLDKVKISDQDVQKFFNSKKDDFKDKKLDDVKANIRSYLFREQQQKYYSKLIGDLKKKANVEMLITPPTIAIEEGDSPAIGPQDAPVRIVEWTDYQCPFCGRSRPTVNQILTEYKGKVRYVLKDFPLSFHKDSAKAHESAHCAGDQGKYWEMNKKLFNSQHDLGIPELKKYAAELKLNQKKFEECLDSGKYTATVQQSQQQGESVGVNGTPAFFINGRMVSGARPFESFQEVIESELARK